jgi:hypothetical protein
VPHTRAHRTPYTMPPYLRQRRRGYYVRVRVPPSLKHLLGHAVEVSLKTRDVKVADRKKHSVVGACRTFPLFTCV